jgi:shikimate dehydrogenase
MAHRTRPAESRFNAPIIGNPVVQVQAPAILNPRFIEAGLPVWMDALLLPIDGYDEAFDALLKEPDTVAVTITIPFKIMSLRHCTELDQNARLAGSTNLMVRLPNGGWQGRNTDGPGFVAALRKGGFEPKGKRAYMMGAGGAGHGLAAAFSLAGIRSIDVYDRKTEKSTSLAALIKVARALNEPPPSLADYDLLVNATSLGLQANDALPMDLSTARSDAFVGDVVAEPTVTAFRQQAMRRGLSSIGGIDMLAGQTDLLFDGVVEGLNLAQAEAT